MSPAVGGLLWWLLPGLLSPMGEALPVVSPTHGIDLPADTLTGEFPVGREAVEALSFPPLAFDPPEAAEHQVLDVPVFHLHDPAFPLVDVYVQLRGGITHFPREKGPTLNALPTLLRSGGTATLPPDSVDARLDLLALQLSVGSGGGGSFAALNSLTRTVDEGLELLEEILLRPGFDEEAVEVWRGQELERIRRRVDDPGSLAFAEFNRLMFGDHPVGWVFTEEEVRAPSPEEEGHRADPLGEERLRELHAQLYCRENLILGISGDLSWEEAEPRIRRFLQAWPACPSPLADPPTPDLRRGPGVFILPREVEQTTVVLAGPGGLRQEDSPEFFASRIANSILGAGGFTSRVFSRVRTERGLAYGASSLWTTPLRYEGLVGAVTATRPERAVEAVELLHEILEEFREAPPTQEELTLAVDQILNGYVFAFQSASQVVARRMGDRAQELPEGWLARYLEGIQEVTREAVHEVARRYIHPGEMTLLLVGDPERFGPGLERFGPLYRVDPDGTVTPWEGPPWVEPDPVGPSARRHVDGGDPEGEELPPNL